MAGRTLGRIRRHARIPLKVVVKVTGKKDFPFTMSRDISEGGVFLVTRQPPPPGTKMRLEFTLPDTPMIIAVEAEAVSSLPYDSAKGDGGLYGVGVRFLNLQEEAKDAIRAFVEKDRIPHGSRVKKPIGSTPAS